MKLYSYWRSTTSVRVRCALNLKGVDYEMETIDLTKGEQASEDYIKVNPIKGVPALVLDDGTVLTQSLAILDYLDAKHPEPPMLPGDDVTRAQVLAAALVVACDIHPVNNLKILSKLRGDFAATPDQIAAWNRHWMEEGFAAFQTLIRSDTLYTFGDTPNMADLCLVGQMVNARRWEVDMTPYARLVEIDARLREIPEIAAALPEAQPDAPKT